MKRLTKKRIDKYQQLYEEAVSRYLDKTDFSVYEWLSDKEAQEFEELQNLIDG